MGETVFGLLLIIIPIGAIVFFVVSLCLFISVRNKNRRSPGSVDEHTLKTRKIMLIISAVIAALFVVMIIGFITLLTLAISNM